MSVERLCRIGSWGVLGLSFALLAAACGETIGPVACGEGLTCEEGSVCVITEAQRNCGGLAEGESCEPGTKESLCGGIGEPCCCGPTPPPDYHCLSADICDGEEPSCDCLAPCADIDACAGTQAAYTFLCYLNEV